MNASLQASPPVTDSPGEPTPAPVPTRPADDDFIALRSDTGVYVVLDQFGVMDASGDDAAAFLHTQLTNDIQSLEAGSVRLAGFCSPKGRLLATLLAWRAADAVRMLISADLRPQIQKRLSMFVLRAKVRLVNATDALAVVAFAGNVRSSLSQCFDALPDGVHVKIDGPRGALMRVPDADGIPRYLWVGPKADVHARLAELDAAPGGARRVNPAVWDWLDIRAGEPRVSALTYEQFVPQMINFEIVGGVSFHKGCYPGQEVVARAQYRGTIKRRMRLAHADTAHAGAELFHSDDPGQPCGTVVNAAAAPGAGVDCLIEVKLAALDSGTVHVGTPDGPALSFLPLPYPLPAGDA
jgi:tRNA-modifying protein YgfZ